MSQRAGGQWASHLKTHVCQACLIGWALLPVSSQGQIQKQAQGSLEAVTVSGKEEGYKTSTTSTATKSDALIRDIPQSITVISEALVRDQSMQSMADVVRYVPGIGIANGEGNRDSPIFRGISSASGDLYIDGVRDDVEYYRDLYNISSIEVMSGPNAMIFGRGGSGGVINRVSKQADWGSKSEASLTLGSWNNRRVTADVGSALNDAAAVRLTAMKQEADGYQRNFHQKREGFNPTMAFKLSSQTLWNLGYEYTTDNRTADRGIPSFNGVPLNTDVSAFFGDPNPATRPSALTVKAFTSLITHDLGGNTTLSNRTRYTDYDKFYQNYNASLNGSGSTITMAAYNNHQWRKNTFNQTDLNTTFKTGGIEHKLLLGMELGQQNTDYLRLTGNFNGTTATSVNVPLANAEQPYQVTYVYSGGSDRDGRSEVAVAGLYAQDQIELSRHLQVISGLRYDKFGVNYRNNVTGENLSSSDSLVSPRVGIVYKPIDAISIYVNYSLAYFPRAGDQLSSLTTANQSLSPEKFVNREIGVKWDILPNLSSRVAVYQLKRSNVAVLKAGSTTEYELLDGQRTNGIEVGLGGNLTKKWSVMGGYAYQDSKLTTTASTTALDGATAGQTPQNTFSLWNRYDFTSSWGAGLGVISRSDMYASTSNSVTLPAYTRMDAALFYKTGKRTQLQLNVENLTDTKYYSMANSDQNITPGAPVNVRVSLTVAF